jgi:plasmid stabilization system protein ParE
VAYSIVWTDTALSSVAEAAEYIAKDSPSYAAALIDTVTIVAFVHGARDLAALLPTLEQS